MYKKRLIVIHGWDANSKLHWFPWLKKEMEKKNYEVIIPNMPGGKNPELEEWLKTLQEAVGIPDKKTYFIGHSLGCITICHYLSNLPTGTKIGGCIFVAGFLKDDEPDLLNFCERNFDLSRLKNSVKKFVVIASRDDPVVPFAKALKMQNKLGAKLVIQDGKGHFNTEDGVTELPIVVEELQKMRQK